MFAVCDRIENGIAVLVFDDESIMNVQCELLCRLAGAEIGERDVLDVSRDGDVLRSARLDIDEKKKRLDAAAARLRRLAGR